MTRRRPARFSVSVTGTAFLSCHLVTFLDRRDLALRVSNLTNGAPVTLGWKLFARLTLAPRPSNLQRIKFLVASVTSRAIARWRSDSPLGSVLTLIVVLVTPMRLGVQHSGAQLVRDPFGPTPAHPWPLASSSPCAWRRRSLGNVRSEPLLAPALIYRQQPPHSAGRESRARECAFGDNGARSGSASSTSPVKRAAGCCARGQFRSPLLPLRVFCKSGIVAWLSAT